MIKNKKIFLASRFEEFSQIRKLLKDEFINRGVELIDLNDNMANSHPPIERSLENVRQADIMLLLVGDTYGTIPSGEFKSYTHLEYDEALKSQLDIYVFCIGSSYSDKYIKYSSNLIMEEWQRQLEINHTLSYFDSERNKEVIVDAIMKSIDKKPEPKVWFDEDTGLMWQVKIDASEEHGRYHWEDVFNYKDSLNKNNFGGYSDWRIPSFIELQTLMTQNSYPNIDSSDEETFIKKPLLNSMTMKYGRFWTKTENQKNKDLAYGINFNRVREDSLSKNGNKEKYKTRYIRCVRLYTYEEIENEWNTISTSTDIQTLELFRKKHPNSKYDEKIQKKLHEVKQAEMDYLNSLSPLQKKLLKLKENNENIPEITLLLKGIRDGVFNEDKCDVLKKIKTIMIEEGNWKESSTAKKPQKDKEFQKTLEIISLMEACT